MSNTIKNGHSSNTLKDSIQLKNLVNFSKKEAIEELQTTFGSIRSKLNTKLFNSSIFAIIQDNPCLVKCQYELRNKNNNNIDSFYTAKHEWIKRKIIDAILDKFGNQIEVKSEYSLPNGKLDIIILQMFYDKIQIQYKTKTIAIEIKSGETVNSKFFCQVERYLTDADVLLMIRVPTQDVVAIYSEKITTELVEDLSLLRRKAEKLLSNSVKKVPGDWCRECNADCEFKKYSKWTSSPNGSFEGYEELLKNVNIVITKLIIILEQLLKEYQQKEI